jgi:hypothetical protein
VIASFPHRYGIMCLTSLVYSSFWFFSVNFLKLSPQRKAQSESPSRQFLIKAIPNPSKPPSQTKLAMASWCEAGRSTRKVSFNHEPNSLHTRPP